MLPGLAARGRGGPLQFPGQPSDHSTPTAPEGSSTLAPGPKASSMAFAQHQQARLPLVPRNARVRHDDVAGFASCCGLASRHPLYRVLSLRFDADLSIDAGSQLPGTLASPRTGLTPAGCPELDAQLHLFSVLDLYGRPSCW